MQVHIQNDGPVTISIETPSPKPAQQKQVSQTTKHLFIAGFFPANQAQKQANHEVPCYGLNLTTFQRFLQLGTCR